MSANKLRVFILVVLATAVWASGVIPAIIPAAVPTAFKQGNSAKFQLAGTVAGTGATLCTDANGNTTTSGCAGTGSGTVGSGTQFQVAQYTGAGTTTAVAGVSIPDCLDTGGKHLNFAASTGVYTCGTSGGGTTTGLFYPTFTAPISTDFTWANQQTASFTTSNGIIYQTVPQLTGDNLNALEHAIPGGGTPWSVTVAVIASFPSSTNTDVGLEVRDSVGGHMGALAGFSNSSQSGANASNCINGTLTAWSHVAGTKGSFFPGGGLYFFKVRNDGTNLTFSLSADGVQFSTVCAQLLSGFANAPNKVGIFVQSENVASNTNAAWYSYAAGL